MCLMCIEFQKGRMTLQEAKNNLRELILTVDKGMTLEELEHLDALHFAEDMTDEMFKYKEDEDE